MSDVPLGRRKWKGEPCVLFVEGHSDLTFYAEMLEDLRLEKKCFIQNLGGKGRNKLRQEVSLLLKPDNLAQVRFAGVILDADENADAAFRMAHDALQAALGVSVPAVSRWTDAEEGRTRFGIHVVGGDPAPGEVESLAWVAWKETPGNEGLSACVEEFMACAKARGERLASPDKVRIGAMLAVRNEEDPRLGPAARAKCFHLSAPGFASLREFLAVMQG